MLNIKLQDNHVFTQENLDLYRDVNKSESRFPEIYKTPSKWKVKKDLVSLSKINIPIAKNQTVRAGKNPQYKEIQKDIENRGFCLDGLSIVLTPNGTRFDTIDGVTKLSILKRKDVANVPATIIHNIKQGEIIKLGIKLNLKDKPFGEASPEDIIEAVTELARKDIEDENKLKGNGELIDSISAAVNEVAGPHLTPTQLHRIITGVEKNVTGKTSIDHPSNKEATDIIHNKFNLKNDSENHYIVTSAFPEKGLFRAMNVYADISKTYPDVTLNVIVYSGSINPKNPEADWHNKCGMPFHDTWVDNLNSIGNCYFDGTAPRTDKIKLIGAIPQIVNYKGNDPKYKYGKLYRY